MLVQINCGTQEDDSEIKAEPTCLQYDLLIKPELFFSFQLSVFTGKWSLRNLKIKEVSQTSCLDPLNSQPCAITKKNIKWK